MSDLLSIYRHALLARFVDERLEVLARGGRIALHPDGQRAEIAIVAATLALRETDWVFPTARDHAAALARGVPVETYVSQVLGNANDPMQGHAAPGCFASKDKRVAPPSGQLAQHLTQAAGFAWAMRLRKDDGVVLALLPETAADAGDFHSAVNFAGVTKAPIVFLVRTDGNEAPAPEVEIADKAIAYGVASVDVSAEPLAVLEAVREACARARRGEGPTIVEARISLEHDPLEKARKALIADGAFDEGMDMHHRQELRAAIESAVHAALAAPAPAAETIFDHVLGTVPSHLARQRDELRATLGQD
jgi:TPP-dependent pyruvate/acetoin dehydrogenase alpha subunit